MTFCTVAYAPLQMAHVWWCVAAMRSEPHVLSAAQLSASTQGSCVSLAEPEICSISAPLHAKTEAPYPKISGAWLCINREKNR